MRNVYDLIDEFYQGDPEWNDVLPQTDVHNYLRAKTWKGADDNELFRLWEHIVSFTIFLGNAEQSLETMERENFIDCVAWCVRNVSGFSSSPEHIAAFLDDLGDFYALLKKNYHFLKPQSPAEAKEKLLADGRLNMIDEQGNFLPSLERTNLYSTPDLSVKIVLNMPDDFCRFLDCMGRLAERREFKTDIKRASLFFYSLYEGLNCRPEGEGAFWEYFFYDYHLLYDDLPFIKYLLKNVRKCERNLKENINVDILQIFSEAQLTLFTVKAALDEGVYSCIDVFTQEEYVLNINLPPKTIIGNKLVMAHIFYDKSFITNGISVSEKNKTQIKRFVQDMELLRSWLNLRYHDKTLTMAETIARLPMMTRYIYLSGWERQLKAKITRELEQHAYQAHPLLEDQVTALLRGYMESTNFGKYAEELLLQLWSDYVHQGEIDVSKIRSPRAWAAGALKLFMDINSILGINTADIEEITGMLPGSFARTSKAMRDVLGLDEFYSRYFTEETLLYMILF
jgi:hypothetical protein